MYHDEYEEPTAHELARGLDAKQAGPKRWEARCPSHGGRSLSISTGRDGRALVHCFGGGCTQDEVLEALRDQGLWPRRGERPPGRNGYCGRSPPDTNTMSLIEPTRQNSSRRPGGCTNALLMVAALRSRRISTAGALTQLPRRHFATFRRESQATTPR